jgi:AcrR family transcriptional regulator
VSPPTRSGKKISGAPRRKPRDLTRDKAINAAVALIDETGADGVSMRSVAAALGVTPMAL